MVGPALPEPIRAIKYFFRQLVELCGGNIEAAKIAGVDQALISRYYGRDNLQVPRCDVTFALELAAGNPVMTRAAATQHGYELLPKDAVGSSIILNKHIGSLTRAMSDVTLMLVEAQRNGVTVSEYDQAQLEAKIDDAHEALELLRADINRSAVILTVSSRA